MPPRRVDPLAAALVALACATLLLVFVPATISVGGVSTSTPSNPRGYIVGAQVTVDGDQDLVVEGPAYCRDRDNTRDMVLAADLDVNNIWLNLDVGAEAASTWYYVWWTETADGTDAVVISLSASAPTFAGTVVAERRVLVVRNDSASNLFQGSTIGDGQEREFRYRNEGQTTSTFNPLAAGTATIATDFSVATLAPDLLGVWVMSFWRLNSGNVINNSIHGNTTTGNEGTAAGWTGSASNNTNTNWPVFINADQEIAYLVGAGGSTDCFVHGFGGFPVRGDE